MGIPVVETDLIKLKVKKDGEVKKKTVKVSARKIPLKTIREDALKSQKDFEGLPVMTALKF